MKRQILVIIFFSLLLCIGRNADAQCVLSADYYFTPDSPYVNTPVSFYSLADTSCGALNYQWFFPNGNPATSNLENPVVTWIDSGSFLITFIVSNESQSDTSEQTLTVLGPTNADNDCDDDDCLVEDPCNLICNPEFISKDMTASSIVNGFAQMVFNWFPSHGTPDWNLTDVGSPPVNPGFGSMWANSNNAGEGIYTCAPFAQGDYIFSLYRAASSNQGGDDLDMVNIILSNGILPNQSTDYPTIFAPLEIIYSESDIPNTKTWEQHVVCFSTLDDYNTMTILPGEFLPHDIGRLWIDQVELMPDVFGAGPDHTVLCGESVQVGIDLCEITNMEYQWYLGQDLVATGDQPTLTPPCPPASYVYTLVRTFVSNNDYPVFFDEEMCELTEDIIVTVLPNNALADAGPDEIICVGGSVQLNASGGTTYSWLPTTGLSDPDIANPVASPTVTTTYTVTVSDNCCVDTDEVLVTVTDEGPCFCLPDFDFDADIWIHPGWHSTTDLPAQYVAGFNGFTGYIFIEGTFFIDNDFAFSNCPNIYLGTDATIELEGFSTNDQATLRIIDSHLRGCDYLWTTIRADNEFESVSVLCTGAGTTIIEDAKEAIIGLGQANFISSGTNQLHLVQFKDNRTHIKLTGDPANQLAPLILATEFKCGTLLPEFGIPGAPVKTVNAVRFINMAGVVVGDSDGLDDILGTADDIDLRNHITEFTQCGIFSQNSTLEVRNTRFENFLSSATSTWGIKSEVSGAIPPNRHLYVIGNINDPLTTNRFIKLQTGISSTPPVGQSNFTNMDVFVTDGNYFSHSGTFGKYGVYVSRANRIRVWDNEFNYARITGGGAAIETTTNNNATELKIYRNTITNNFQATGQSPSDCWGIKHFQPSDISVKVVIWDNIISGGKFGIEVNGDHGVEIDQNTITQNRCWDSGNFGIRTVSANYTNITQNTVNKTYVGSCSSSNFKFTGIYCDASIDPNICENTLTGVSGTNLIDDGIWLNSTAIGTVSTDVLKNSFKYCARAFKMSQGADMGFQPKTSNPATSENDWQNCVDETYYALSAATNGSGTSNFKYDPACPGYAINCLPDLNNGDAGVIWQAPVTVTYNSDPDCGPWLDDGGGEGRMVAMINEYNEMGEDEVKWMKEQMLYEFAEDSFANSSLSAIQNFIEDAGEKPVSAFKTIESLIIAAHADTTLETDTNMINVAKMLNDGISEETDFDLYRKQVNDVYLRTTAKGKPIGSSDLQVLLSIASLCPYQGGTAVYQARVLVSEFDTTSFDDSDCMIDVSYRVQGHDDKFDNKFTSSSTAFKLYPNPAKDELTIQFDQDSEVPVRIDLINNIGSLIKSVDCREDKCEIDLHAVPNGIYFLRFGSDDENQVVEKLIIAK